MNTPTPGNSERIEDVLKKIERTRQARRHKFYLRDEKITLSHGSGGKSTHNLIEGVFAPAFSNPLLDAMDDAATFGLHHRHLRGQPALLSRWRYRETGYTWHYQRPGNGRCDTLISLGRLYSGRRFSNQRLAPHCRINGNSSEGS